MKRLVSLLLACLMLLALCACGKQTPASSAQSVTEGGKRVWYLGGNSLTSKDVDPKELFADVADTIDPAAIYSSLELTEEMVQGSYALNDPEKDLATVRKEIPFEEVQFKDSTANVTILPTAVYLGADYISCSRTGYKYSEYAQIKDHAIAVLELATADQVGQTPCIYEISGNTITFKQISKTSTGEAPFAYELTGVEFSYQFKLYGPYMEFSRDGHSLKLTAFCFTEGASDDIIFYGYSLPDSPLIGGVDYMACSSMFNYAIRRDGAFYDRCAYKLDEEGRCTVYLADMDSSGKVNESFVAQYAYIIRSDSFEFMTDFGIILLDGTKTYYYTDDSTKREARVLADQGVDVDSMTEDQIKEIAQKKEDLFDDLQSAFEAEGISATINRSTGEIALDATVLFAVDESEISGEGKSFLQKFMGVYTSVVFGEKYEGFIDKILIQGHTDTSGSYEMNQTLSQARADSVKAYCLSAECGVDQNHAAALQTMLEAKGYAYDKPVYDENGEVDMDASRRVSFCFLVKLGQ